MGRNFGKNVTFPHHARVPNLLVTKRCHGLDGDGPRRGVVHGGAAGICAIHGRLNVAFGKNRVQYRTFEWQYFEQGMFEVYHYREGDQIAGQVARILEEEAKALAPLFGRNLKGPIQVLVFKSQEEFRQSNVGIMTSQDEETNIGGTARLVGSKMFLYATGDRLMLERDVRQGLATILFNQAMYDSQWSEALRSSTLVQVPEWMSEGAARYAARGLDPESMAEVLDACQTGGFERLDQSTGREAAVLGQAVWSYVADIYGTPAMANVLYMTRITRDVENGFRLATGYHLDDLAAEVRAYHARHAHNDRDQWLPDFPTRKSLRRARRSLMVDGMEMKLQRRYEYTQFLPSPDGSTLAFTTNERGQLRVGTVDLKRGNARGTPNWVTGSTGLTTTCTPAWLGTPRASFSPSPLSSVVPRSWGWST